MSRPIEHVCMCGEATGEGPVSSPLVQARVKLALPPVLLIGSQGLPR